MTVHELKPEQKSETRKAFDESAKMRMECYKAHIDAGFDHDSAIIFVQLDTTDIWHEQE